MWECLDPVLERNLLWSNMDLRFLFPLATLVAVCFQNEADAVR